MATRIDGTAIAKAIREKINADIHHKQETDPKYKPSLVIVQGRRLDRSVWPLADHPQSEVSQTQVRRRDFKSSLT
jgi:methylenetetrahydrofolate dehydrogenase (NADP+)/methenyltetrahydrofolate cyclohydrolase/formyltetrahydrofolate synthetase